MREKIPICPFCWGSLSYPEEIRLSAIDTILGGHCFLCGARFIVDVTGKNVGEVMVHGLQMVANELGKDLTLLVEGEDYEDTVLIYDLKRHESPGPAGNMIDGNARMYVIRSRKKRDD